MQVSGETHSLAQDDGITYLFSRLNTRSFDLNYSNIKVTGAVVLDDHIENVFCNSFDLNVFIT